MMRTDNVQTLIAPSLERQKPDLSTRGFSLVELLAVLAVLAAVLTTAPSMARMVRQAHIQGTFFATSSSLALARLSAISSGQPVTLCPSSDGGNCTGGTDWSYGWIVYLDPGRKSNPQSPSDVLEVVSPLRGGVSMRTTAGRLRIRYHPSGWASGSNLGLTLCVPTGALAGKVVINNAGRSRIERAQPGLPCPYDT